MSNLVLLRNINEQCLEDNSYCIYSHQQLLLSQIYYYCYFNYFNTFLHPYVLHLTDLLSLLCGKIIKVAYMPQNRCFVDGKKWTAHTIVCYTDRTLHWSSWQMIYYQYGVQAAATEECRFSRTGNKFRSHKNQFQRLFFFNTSQLYRWNILIAQVPAA